MTMTILYRRPFDARMIALRLILFAELTVFWMLPVCPLQARQVSSLPACPDPGICFITQKAKDDWAAQHGCSFANSGSPGTRDCSVKWRESELFLETSEGALIENGYVPTYTRDVKDKKGNIIHKKGDVIGASGVTISTGIDLGQQSKSGTQTILESYVKDKGNPDNVDVDALMKKLDPYFGKKKQDALDALDDKPLSVTSQEAALMEKAFGYDTQTKVAKQFDKNNTQGMTFQKLPEEAQTVIIDFAYQYGLSATKGNVRKTFWDDVYSGEWKKLADWLKGNPDPYKSRRQREGDRLQKGIDDGNLPEAGDPCATTAGSASP